MKIKTFLFIFCFLYFLLARRSGRVWPAGDRSGVQLAYCHSKGAHRHLARDHIAQLLVRSAQPYFVSCFSLSFSRRTIFDLTDHTHPRTHAPKALYVGAGEQQRTRQEHQRLDEHDRLSLLHESRQRVSARRHYRARLVARD